MAQGASAWRSSGLRVATSCASRADGYARNQDHPFGFAARPRVMPDGSTNLLLWDCKVPGKAGTAWEGADFALTLGA